MGERKQKAVSTRTPLPTYHRLWQKGAPPNSAHLSPPKFPSAHLGSPREDDSFVSKMGAAGGVPIPDTCLGSLPGQHLPPRRTRYIGNPVLPLPFQDNIAFTTTQQRYISPEISDLVDSSQFTFFPVILTSPASPAVGRPPTTRLIHSRSYSLATRTHLSTSFARLAYLHTTGLILWHLENPLLARDEHTVESTEGL